MREKNATLVYPRGRNFISGIAEYPIRLSIILHCSLNGESGKDIIMAERMHSWFNVNVKVNENT